MLLFGRALEFYKFIVLFDSYSMNLQDMYVAGCYIGLAVATLPAVATALIASSKIIAVHIIADLAVRLLTGNAYTVTAVTGFSFIAVPLLWKISLVAALAGGAIMAVSLTAALVHYLYDCYIAAQRQA